MLSSLLEVTQTLVRNGGKVPQLVPPPIHFQSQSSQPPCGTWRARSTGNFFLEVHMNTAIVLWGGGKRRSWEREALLIAATAGIATAIGAAIGGKKGATFGAVSGGATRFLMRLLSW